MRDYSRIFLFICLPHWWTIVADTEKCTFLL